MIINTNVPALFAENALSNTTNSLQTLQQELSTGYQINSPADNPAGLAISTLMQGELGGLNSATANANQAVNLLTTANGGIQNDVQIVQNIQQLAVQASSGTNSTQDRQDIQSQINQLISQLDNNANSINYNGINVLQGNYSSSVTFTGNTTVANIALGVDSGNAAAGTYTVSFAATGTAGTDLVTIGNGTASISATVAMTDLSVGNTTSQVSLQIVSGASNTSGGLNDSFNIDLTASALTALDTTATSGTLYSTSFSVTAGSSLTFQVGPTQGSENTQTTNLGKFDSVALGLNNLDVVNAGSYAITLAQNALSMLSNAQGGIGAQMDQLNYTVQNLQTENTNLQAARSTIMDANMAQVTSQFAQEQILQQTGIQSLAQAQQLPQLVLKLLG